MKKRGVLLVIFLIFCIFQVSAEENLDKILSEEVVAPPPPPEEEDQLLPTLILTLKDYNTKLLVGDIHVDLIIFDEETERQTKTLKYVPEDGVLILSIEPSTYSIKFMVDVIDTPGKDYFFNSNFDVEDDVEQIIYLLPVGSAIGSVYDSKGNVIRDARVNFECNKDYCDLSEIKTNSFGVFNADVLPIGNCKVSAMKGNYVGYANVSVSQGELGDIDITLNKGVSSNQLFYFILIIILFILIVYYIYRNSNRIKKEEKEIKEVKKEVVVHNSRADDILNTLNQKEKSIVNFLMQNDNKANQSKIRYELRIPKTTLSRLLEKLELKKIIKIEKVGKLKKIELTEWFLGNK